MSNILQDILEELKTLTVPELKMFLVRIKLLKQRSMLFMKDKTIEEALIHFYRTLTESQREEFRILLELLKEYK